MESDEEHHRRLELDLAFIDSLARRALEDRSTTMMKAALIAIRTTCRKAGQ